MDEEPLSVDGMAATPGALSAASDPKRQGAASASVAANPADSKAAQAKTDTDMPMLSLSWDTFGRMLQDLYRELEKIQAYETWEYICGFPRGGLIVAVYLAKHMDLPMINLEQLYVSKGLKVLLVQDVVSDVGVLMKTKEQLAKNKHKIYTATLYLRCPNGFDPQKLSDLYLEKTNIWVRLPYDKY